jgi:hypothetical protein
MTRDIPKIIFLSVCAILLGLGLAKAVKADGYEPGYKDQAAEYRYSSRPQKVSYGRRYIADCDPHLTKYECRRFREKMAERANGRVIRKSRITERRYEREERYYDRPVRRKRYAEAGRYYSDAEYRRRECKPLIKVTGVERTLQPRAEESARKAWRREAIDSHGYQYAGGFRSVRVSCDNIRGFVWICRASGRPCRED